MTGRTPHVETQHVNIEPLLATYRELDEASRLRVDAHLAECPDCAARLAEFEAVDRQIADLADPPPDGAAVGAWRTAMRLRGDGNAAPATSRRTTDGPADWTRREARGDARHRPGIALVASAAIVLGLIVLVAGGTSVVRPLQEALVRWGRDPLPTEPAPPTPTTAPAELGAVVPVATPDMDESPIDEGALSVTADRDLAFNWGHSLSVSADGRFVAFTSRVTDLVPGDTNVCASKWAWDYEGLGDCLDVFVRDTEAGKTRRVSVDTRGDELDGESFAAALTPDGRYLAFRSRADIVQDGSFSAECAKREYPDHCHGIYVKDLVTGEVELLYVLSDFGGIGGSSYHTEISADGRYILFFAVGESDPAPGVPAPADPPQYPKEHWLVYDRQTDTVRYAGPDDRHDLGIDVVEGEVSADGRYRVFASYDATLVPGYTQSCMRTEFESHLPANCSHIFVTDQVSGITERISLAPDGSQAEGDSYSPSISADGRYVAFASNASNLVPDELRGNPNVFVFDRDTGSLTWVSKNESASGWPSTTPRISADGRRIVFMSFSDGLVLGDANLEWDVFSYDREAERTEAISVAGPRPHAVYFARTPSAGDTAVLTPGALRQRFTEQGYRYTEARAWSDVLGADAEARIDVLILDPGSLAEVDRAWVQERANLAIALGGINVRRRELLALVDSNISSTGPDETYPGEFFSVVGEGRTHAVAGSPAGGAEGVGEEAGDLSPFTSNYRDGTWATGTESAVHDAATIAAAYGDALERAGIPWEPWHGFFRDIGKAVSQIYTAELYGALGAESAGAGGE